MSRLWYRQPAGFWEWEEALPVGNGRLGGMVYGRTDYERIQLNEESIWYGKPLDRNNPDALGNLEKTQTRKIAQDFGLPVAQKPDSQEICFIKNENYVEFIKNNFNFIGQKGNFVDKSGNILGKHDGILTVIYQHLTQQTTDVV